MIRKILRTPLITEKSMRQAQEKNVYVFIVEPRANKNQIKQEVETVFGVKVNSVRTVMEPTRVRRTGPRRRPVTVPVKKKAFVTVQSGQKIDIFDVINES